MNTALKFIIDQDIPFIKGVLEPFGVVKYMRGKDIDRQVLQDVDAMIIRTRTHCNEKTLKGTKVRMIATATIGKDHIDEDYCHKAGIHFTNAPGCNSGSVMQYIASALIRLSLKHQFDLKKKVLGVIGHGNVGSKVAKMARLLGMQVLVNDPPLARQGDGQVYYSLEEIKEKSDIITLHVPLNREGKDKTLNLVDQSFIDGLKKKPFLINSSRGEVVHEDDLKQALRSGAISGAVLDVWHNEPNIDRNLLAMADITTAHIAGYSADGKANGSSMSVQALSLFFNLGLDDWHPSDIPLSSKSPVIDLDTGTASTPWFVLPILHSYDILEDDFKLRQNPGEFDKLRATYAIRREFHAYKFNNSPIKSGIAKKLEALGFEKNE